jgi:integrin beta 3
MPMNLNASGDLSSLPKPVTSPFEMLAAELGAVAGRIEREAHLKINNAITEAKNQHMALELRFVRMEEMLTGVQKELREKLATLKDGKDGHDGKDGAPGKDGQDGVAGPRGEPGAPGKDGADGRNGIDGKAGPAGARGAIGLQGLRGLEGTPGKNGINGAPGLNGQRGERGERGERGAPGIVGKDGAPGLKGDKGDTGLPGMIGERGPPGINGKDGSPGIVGKDGARGEKGERGEAGPPGMVGRDGAPGARGEMGLQGLRGMKGDSGIDGSPGRDGVIGPRGERGEKGFDGTPGRLPKVRAWKDGVSYDGDVVTYDGGLYQAMQDTSRAPNVGSDWVCLARSGLPGKDGVDGRSLTIKGTYSDMVADYKYLDVVTVDHTWHVALKDKPGACPGPDWKAGPGIGRTGKPGERGEKGERGKDGPAGLEIVGWDVDRRSYILAPVMSDGSRGPPCSVRDLFDQFQMEIR